jgi:hypothetical protein
MPEAAQAAGLARRDRFTTKDTKRTKALGDLRDLGGESNDAVR